VLKTIIAAVVTCFVFSCTPPMDANRDGIADGIKTPDNVSVVAPSSPIGSISGVVANTKFVGIEGATVTVTLGGRAEDGMGKIFTASTAADGSYSFQKVPAGGTGFVTVSKAGFGLARTSVTVPAAAGNVPLNDGNGSADLILLTELNYTAKFTVLTSAGRPAKGAKGLIEVTPSATRNSGGAGYGVDIGVTSVEATVDDTGVLQFAGVPSPSEIARIDGTYTVFIGAIDDDKDGRPEFNGSSRSFSGSAMFLNNNPQFILLANTAAGAPTIVASNLESLRSPTLNTPLANDVKPTDAINVVFNQAIVDSTKKVTVVAEDCGTAVAVTVTMKAPNVMIIAPASSWSDGAEHNLAIRVTGAESGVSQNFVTTFFALDPAMPKTVSSMVSFQLKKNPMATMDLDKLKAGDRLFVVFSSPVRNLGSDARVFVNFDLNMNGSNVMNLDQYEFGSPLTSGWPVAASETLSDATNGTFSCVSSTYTSRLEVNPPLLPIPAPASMNGIPLGTQFKIVIPKDTSGNLGYQTPWGQAFSGEFTGALTAAP
jgi:hypothetical protein